MNAKSKSFRNCCFTHAGFPYEEGIVFLSSAEYLHNSIELRITANERVKFSLCGIIGEVDGKFFQYLGIVSGLLGLRTPGWRGERFFLQPFSRQFVGDKIDHCHFADTHGGEEINGMGLILGENRDQHVTTVHLLFAAALDVGDSSLEDTVKSYSMRRITSSCR